MPENSDHIRVVSIIRSPTSSGAERVKLTMHPHHADHISLVYSKIKLASWNLMCHPETSRTTLVDKLRVDTKGEKTRDFVCVVQTLLLSASSKRTVPTLVTPKWPPIGAVPLLFIIIRLLDFTRRGVLHATRACRYIRGRVAKWHRVTFRFRQEVKIVGSSPVVVALLSTELLLF